MDFLSNTTLGIFNVYLIKLDICKHFFCETDDIFIK